MRVVSVKFHHCSVLTVLISSEIIPKTLKELLDSSTSSQEMCSLQIKQKPLNYRSYTPNQPPCGGGGGGIRLGRRRIPEFVPADGSPSSAESLFRPPWLLDVLDLDQLRPLAPASNADFHSSPDCPLVLGLLSARNKLATRYLLTHRTSILAMQQ